eukprot:CAMPEP_0170341700 /NCGR_PEP_ID=MMETSP0116_2-20130129/71977_1 /TAXON_ID=400756 /ORGANISM="Durinskia baltica, Strain CSIRO CS-38" /LENGTH=63 /DNA_ID=CAMNT_0010595257 /DNA_START=59 /DNA_END=250 /DNA_ORIENTATION=-
MNSVMKLLGSVPYTRINSSAVSDGPSVATKSVTAWQNNTPKKYMTKNDINKEHSKVFTDEIKA